jgi:opine dehydrogenase
VSQYGADVTDRSSLRRIFCSNTGYKGCGTPMLVSSSGQYTPHVDTRLFWEDIPFGLCILKNLAEMLGTQIFFSTVKFELSVSCIVQARVR